MYSDRRKSCGTPPARATDSARLQSLDLHKTPEAMISICVTLDRIVTDSPRDIWQSHGSNLGVSLDEFEY
jgi:hypothetical protein